MRLAKSPDSHMACFNCFQVRHVNVENAAQTSAWLAGSQSHLLVHILCAELCPFQVHVAFAQRPCRYMGTDVLYRLLRDVLAWLQVSRASNATSSKTISQQTATQDRKSRPFSHQTLYSTALTLSPCLLQTQSSMLIMGAPAHSNTAF